MNLFSLTSRIYKNVENTKVNLIKIENAQINELQKNARQLFSLLDRKDIDQKHLTFRVWLLRSTIFFTLLDFDDESLKLSEQIKDIKILGVGYPSILPIVEEMEKVIKCLILSPKNPKRTWLDNFLSINTIDRMGIFINLSHGRSPGWGGESPGPFSSYNSSKISYFRNLSDVKNISFNRVLLPCGCSNSPYHILANLLYSGITPEFDVLLYPSENFVFPKRLELPIDEVLQSKFKKSVFDFNEVKFSAQANIEEIDSWINESFWDELHKGQRRYSEQLIPAHYLLFKNGTGTFLPKNGRAQVLFENIDGEFTQDCLRQKEVEFISSGDLVVLRNGESGFLLDDTSEEIMRNFGVDDLFANATDWKEALDTLTLTYDWEQISELLRNQNVNVSPSTIKRWAGAEGFGPGNELDFSALMHLLIKENKISIEDEPAEYISKKWQMLRELRGIRQKAGHMIRDELFEALSTKINSLKNTLGDETVIQGDANSDVELIILRVFSVDQIPSYVHQSQIGRIDDLRNNKWLG